MDEASRLRSENERLRHRLDEIEGANRRMRDFTATAFHDLQEPLRKIGAFTDMLDQALARGDQGEAGYAIDVLRRSSRQVQQLVRDILAYSRSTRVELVREPIAVRSVVDEVLSAVAGTVIETSAILTVQADPIVVSADRLLLYHLIVNLVSNGLKFFAPGTEPYLELTVRRRTDGSASICVADRGIGFDAEDGRTIFDPFRRLHGRSAYAGSGLGLSICRTIVDRHGWSIDVESASGAGSRFEISIPAADVV